MTAGKRYRIKFGKRYKKDLRKLARQHADIAKLDAVVDALAWGIPLAPHHRDHALRGTLSGRRGCHITPDWILLYRKDHEALLLLLLSTGDHRQVLEVE